MAEMTRQARPAPRRHMIGFDADDTLWHNEIHYRQAAEKWLALLRGHAERSTIQRVLSETEIRNIRWYGYGFKSYTLSMVEAAIAATEGRLPASAINAILQIGREMLSGEVLLFKHARPTLLELATDYDLMLITKGDLLEQRDKLLRSGLADMFRFVEIVQDKTVESYRSLLEEHEIPVSRFAMVGNSMKSDILPGVEMGARAVFVPYEHTWAHEHADGAGHAYYEIEHLGQLPGLVASWSGWHSSAQPRG